VAAQAPWGEAIGNSREDVFTVSFDRGSNGFLGKKTAIEIDTNIF